MYPLNPTRGPIGVWEEKDFFGREELKKLVALKDTIEFNNGLVGDGKNEPHDDSEIRNSRIGWLQGNEKTQWVYNKIIDKVLGINQEVFGFHITDVEPFQYTTYEVGGHYRPHVDVQRPREMLRIRKLTFTLQLSDENSYDGGDLVIHTSPKPLMLPREAGTLLVFPTYQLHEVTTVTRGSRESLVGWIHGPMWV